MLNEIARGLGLVAMNDPMPGPGRPASLSGSSYVDLGTVELVPSMGAQRWATFREVYLTNPWIWAAVNMLTRSVQRTPAGVFRIDEDGYGVRQRGDVPSAAVNPNPAQRLDNLLSNPTPGISRGAFYGGVTRDKLVFGNGLARLDRANGAEPTGMRRVPWRKVLRVPTGDDDQTPLFYELRRKAGAFETEKLLPNDVIHFGLASDEGVLGVSPLMACRATMALHDAVVRHLLGYLKNATRSNGHIKVDRLTREKATEIRQLIAEMYASPENAGKILVTSGEWTSTSDTPDNAQLVELLHESRNEAAAAYGIPPPVMGILDRAIKSNVAELRIHYLRDVAGPLGTDVTDDIDAQLLPQVPAWRPLCVRLLFDEQMQPDPEGQSLMLQRLGPVLTVDEQRAKIGAPPLKIPGVTDVPWSTPGAAPLSSWQPGGKNARSSVSTTTARPNGHAADRLSARLVHTISSDGSEEDHD